MSKLTDLLRQVERNNPQLAADLEREYRTLSARRAFGLNFERHVPETTEIPGRRVRKDDKVYVQPPRGSLEPGDKTLWMVDRTERVDGGRVAYLTEYDVASPETRIANVDDLVVVAVLRDYIYPGLVETGRVERGGDNPAQVVINGENYHVLQALTYTHRGNVDVIYIDPPYNTGAKDWKYNNDYVDDQDDYRHSKWLAFIERRLQIAKHLLNPESSVLIVTIDEKEYLRLGLLLEQAFPEARIQMVSSVIKPGGVSRAGYFARSDEYLFFVFFGSVALNASQTGEGWGFTDKQSTKEEVDPLYWNTLWRSGSSPQREGHAETFYPIFLNSDSGTLHSVGDPIGEGANRHDTVPPEGTFSVWPIRKNGSEGRWQLGAPALRTAAAKGYVKIGRINGEKTRLYYLSKGEQKKIEAGTIQIVSTRPDGSVVGRPVGDYTNSRIPTTQWAVPSHDATRHGSMLVPAFIGNRGFPYPKSLYAVEDALRFFVKDKPDAVVIDFFAGSGTTAHAVMRLNRQDGGSRQSISVTNNEVDEQEQRKLRRKQLRPGDPAWEEKGICDYITKPRIEAAITGLTPEGKPVQGDYKFTDEFPMAEGFQENAKFFTLTYATRTQVAHNRAFREIAPLLWLRAGARGECIETEPEAGWAVVDAYGMLIDLDASTAFIESVEPASSIGVAYIVTDDERRFQAVARRLPEGVEAVRLYESYLRNFQIRNGD